MQDPFGGVGDVASHRERPLLAVATDRTGITLVIGQDLLHRIHGDIAPGLGDQFTYPIESGDRIGRVVILVGGEFVADVVIRVQPLTRTGVVKYSDAFGANLDIGNVALAIAEEVIALHVGQETSALELPAHLHVLLKEVLFYVMPRVSPDGAEAVMNTGRYVRSTPRDRRPNQNHARWISDDIDGDGLSLLMRVEDPAGEFVQSPDVENLLLPRRLEDPGPYYKVYPEGRIENWNGHTIPDPFYLSDNEPDLNRNFPYFWSPEHEQVGAGRYPMSEPESRAIVEFATAHPNIFTWFNLHTFGGCFIRPRNELTVTSPL